MPDVTWINGRFVERGAATVSAYDAGVLHAVGLFETMLAAGGRVFRVEKHLERLTRSAAELGLSERLSARALEEAVHAVVERSALAEGAGRARVRLTITGGDLNLLQTTAQTQTDPTIVISATPATAYPDEMFERGVGVLVAETKANPLNGFEGHKTLNYWWRLRELQRAAAARMGEALILQVTNHVAGGAVSNLFAVRDGVLLTPIAHTEEAGAAVPAPVLPGITRSTVIELADGLGVGCDKRLLSIDDVLDADELFLTNSSWGVLPVTTVERRPIGPGLPGELTRRLRELWLEAVTLEA